MFLVCFSVLLRPYKEKVGLSEGETMEIFPPGFLLIFVLAMNLIFLSFFLAKTLTNMSIIEINFQTCCIYFKFKQEMATLNKLNQTQYLIC
jgi:hypothetical protein